LALEGRGLEGVEVFAVFASSVLYQQEFHFILNFGFCGLGEREEGTYGTPS
jgi:hypothetical protein